jgi:4-amino-4-deoxy-L-arabinose transferase-like glycosyltransferase
MLARLRRLPAPLLVLLAVTLVEGLAWTFANPPLQNADEPGHVAYVQKIVDAQDLPWRRSVDRPRDDPRQYSTELRSAALWSGLEPLRGNRGARPLWTGTDERMWHGVEDRLPAGSRDDGGEARTFTNPPLYYLYAALPYAATAWASTFSRQEAMRLLNIPFLLGVVALTWLLAWQLLGRSQWLATVAAGVVALQPVLVSVVTGVTPDGLLIFLYALGIELIVLVMNRGPTRPLVTGLAAVCLAAALTHGRGLPLAAVAVLAVALAWWRTRPPQAHRRLIVAGAIAGAVLALVLLLAYTERGLSVDRTKEFASYLWQFYLRPFSFMAPPIFPNWGFRQVFIEQFYGTFDSLEVVFSTWLFDLLKWASVAGLLLVARAAVIRRSAVRARWDLVLVLAAAFLIPLLWLHVQAYHGLLGDPRDPAIAGRYLLPLAPLFGVAVAFALSAMRPITGRVLGGAVLGSMALLQLTGLGLLTLRFYA